VAEGNGKGKLMGKVIGWDPMKGWGFLRQAGTRTDVFVHYTGIVPENGDPQSRRNLVVDEVVTFDIEPSEKDGRPTAVNVRAAE
jgi:cold shock CspA family protein